VANWNDVGHFTEGVINEQAEGIYVRDKNLTIILSDFVTYLLFKK
jgi:hypothetical protein